MNNKGFLEQDATNNPVVDFYVIGAQKAGTSWLYKQFKKMKGFSVPPVKQLHYFDRDSSYDSPNKLTQTHLFKRILNPKWLIKSFGVLGLTLARGKFSMVKWYLKWFYSNYTDKWYLSLFKNFKGLTGEITPSYSILKPEDIAQMYKLSPQAKIVFILRNPIHRAWSHFRYESRKDKNFDIETTTVASIITFIDSPSQELRSDYLRTIDNYLKFYPKEQILIGFFDAIAEKPKDFLAEISAFMGADTAEVKNLEGLSERVNVSREILIPQEIERVLKEKYSDTINELSSRFGGYCTRWKNELDNGNSPDQPKDLSLKSTFRL